MYGPNRREELSETRALGHVAARPARQSTPKPTRAFDGRRSGPRLTRPLPSPQEPLGPAKGVLLGIALGAAIWASLIAAVSWIV